MTAPLGDSASQPLTAEFMAAFEFEAWTGPTLAEFSARQREDCRMDAPPYQAQRVAMAFLLRSKAAHVATFGADGESIDALIEMAAFLGQEIGRAQALLDLMSGAHARMQGVMAVLELRLEAEAQR